MERVGEHRDRVRLRETFGSVAELYDLARPTYPDALLDDLVALAAIPPGGRVLEIGPGTGKASFALASRGLALVGVELAEQLASLARRNLASFPRAEIVVADFETWEPERGDFDAVTAFTAFHWIAPEVRYAKPARLLRSGGALAVVETSHVMPAGSDPFFAEVQADYDAVVPREGQRPPGPPEEVGDLREEIEATGLFVGVEVHRHLWEVEYTADEYLAVLGTYSDNLALPADERDELFARIRARIAPRGSVTKTYLGTLNVAHKPWA
jgi:ubiquinone/menaquinone biosynthesis C-methylase UbiE